MADFSSISNTTVAITTSSTRIALASERSVSLLLLTVGIFGLFGNTVILFVMCKTKTRNTASMFTTNLAIADLIASLFFLPFAVNDYYPIGHTICEASEFFYQISLGVTALTLIALSAYSFLYPRRRHAAIAVSFTYCIWVLAVGFAMLTFFFMGQTPKPYGPEEDTSLCLSSVIEYRNQQAVFRLGVYYTTPLTVVGIFLVLARRKYRNRNGSSRAQTNFTKLVCVLVASYAVCFYPIFLSALRAMLPKTDLSDNFWNAVSTTGFCLCIVYRCLNPVALYVASGGLRKLVDLYLLCWCVSRIQDIDQEHGLDRGLERDLDRGDDLDNDLVGIACHCEQDGAHTIDSHWCND